MVQGVLRGKKLNNVHNEKQEASELSSNIFSTPIFNFEHSIGSYELSFNFFVNLMSSDELNP